MDFTEELSQFSNRIEKLKDNLLTEEATKTSLVLPFFQILGYDVFNPFEFVPELTADTGMKKGEKVDYAILKNRDPIILIEVKPVNTNLSTKHINQLFRYFTVTKAKFGILTNGIIYQFFSDLEESNKMDTVPFLELNLLSCKDESIKELKRFRKEAFDMKGILDSASELKYTAMIKKTISDQFQNPSDQFVKTLINKDIYNGIKTQSIIDKFRELIKVSFNEYINEQIGDLLKNAMNSEMTSVAPVTSKTEFEFSIEELAVLDLVKEMLKADPGSIIYKKTSGYAYMQIGNSSRKWVCRVYIRQSNNLFVLHKFSDTNYECEYYFEEAEQLNQIKEVILDVFGHCLNL